MMDEKETGKLGGLYLSLKSPGDTALKFMSDMSGKNVLPIWLITPEDIDAFVKALEKQTPEPFPGIYAQIADILKRKDSILKKIDEIKTPSRLPIDAFFLAIFSRAISVYRDYTALSPEKRADFIKLLPESGAIGNLNDVPTQLTFSEEGALLAWPLIEPFAELLAKLIEPPKPPQTFALPSHPLMFTLLALFSGNPAQIPRRLFETPFNELSPEDQKQLAKFSGNLKEEILGAGLDPDTGEKRGEDKTRITALVSDSPKVSGELSLFKEDVYFRENALAVYIKKTFGVEGLKHLLGLLIGLEENFRRGSFEWDIHEHLSRLGYKRGAGSYAKAERDASSIIKLFTSIYITANQRAGERTKIEGLRLFSIDGFKQELFKNEVIKEKLIIRATEPWYKLAFEPPDKRSSPRYTKLLKQIAAENHHNHSLTIFLAPLLAVFWRIQKTEQGFSVSGLMEWCNLNPRDHRRTDALKGLEGELNYMVEKNYIGKWENLGYKDAYGYKVKEDPLPSKCGEPFKCLLKLTPPEWLQKEIKQIRAKRETLLAGSRAPALAAPPEMTAEEFNRALANSGLTQKQFGNTVGVSQQMVAAIKAGRKRVSPKIADKVREHFGLLI